MVTWVVATVDELDPPGVRFPLNADFFRAEQQVQKRHAFYHPIGDESHPNYGGKKHNALITHNRMVNPLPAFRALVLYGPDRVITASAQPCPATPIVNGVANLRLVSWHDKQVRPLHNGLCP